MRGAYHDLQVDSTFLLSLEVNVGRRLVESDAEAFELVFEDLFVNERLEDVQDDQNQAACSGDWRNVNEEEKAAFADERANRAKI